MLSGDNGLLTRTTDAKERTGKAEVVENAKLDVLAQIAENKGENISKVQLKSILNTYFDDIDNLELPDDLSNSDIKLNANQTYGGYQNIALVDIYNGKFATESEIEVDYTELSVGDYISNYPVYYDNVATLNNKFTPNDEYANNWRVLSKENGVVKLVSAGVPLTFNAYMASSEDAVLSLTTNFFTTEVSNSGECTYKTVGFKTSGGTAITNVSGIKELFTNEFTAVTGTGNNTHPSVQAMTKDDLDLVYGSTTAQYSMYGDSELNDLLVIPCKDPSNDTAFGEDGLYAAYLLATTFTDWRSWYCVGGKCSRNGAFG